MKTYPNKQRYDNILKSMTSQEKLEKSFELTDLSNAAFKAGLKNKYPNLTECELEQFYLEKLQSCHNRNY